ncbi:MAG: SUF system Fe-S cluster assembly protein [Terriglobia bacterium]
MEEATNLQAKEAPEGAQPSLSISQAILMQDKIVEVLKGCYDPEIPVNIYDLGLIYEVKVDTGGVADVKMTLTSPSCPAAGMLPGEVEYKVKEIPGIKDVRLELVWDPPWDQTKMSEAARLQLGMW